MTNLIEFAKEELKKTECMIESNPSLSADVLNTCLGSVSTNISAVVLKLKETIKSCFREKKLGAVNQMRDEMSFILEQAGYLVDILENFDVVLAERKKNL